MNERQELEFLKDIYGDNIPDNLEREVFPCGSVVYSVGKPNIEKLIEMTLALMS